MTVSIVRLGTPRLPREGLRIGTVRRPPRGVPKAEFGKRDYYDTWLPALAPGDALFREARAATDETSWQNFRRKFKAEMNRPDTARLLDLLAALSRTSDFSVGCYCDNEARCHRSVLRELLAERSASFRP
jgi:uncharacterized protein YeaO (DUF488 family)